MISNTEKLQSVSLTRYGTSGNVSNRYRAIDTQQLVTRIVQDLGLAATVDSVSSQPGRKRTSTKHGVVITLDKPVDLAGTLCYPRIYVRNSYAGESALLVNVGFFRLICSNGMMIGTTHFSGRILHIQSGVDQLPKLRQSVRDAIEWCTKGLPEFANKLNSVVLSVNQISTVLASIGASTALGEAVTYKIAHPEHIRAEDKQPDGSLSAWNVWNIVNEQQRNRSRSQLRQLDVNARLLDAVEAVIQTAA